MRRPTPSRRELDAAWEQAKQIHQEYLDPHGVRLPAATSYKWVWLAMLFHFRPGGVHKNEVSDAVRSVFPQAAPDQQVRHLKRDGWNVEDQGQGVHALVHPFEPFPGFVNEQARRRGRLAATDFAELKQAFGNRCATCGAPEGQPDPRYGGDVVSLQQGHRDPDGPANDPKNIIPQCGVCNRAYRRDFVFDEKGRARAIADIGPVKRARKTVRTKVREYLNRNP